MIILNPELAQIESLAEHPPFAKERLTAAAIRAQFLTAPDWLPEQTDEHEAALRAGQPLRDAAVLILLVQRSDGLQILFTRRSAQLTHHAGQISFPGGRTDPDDRDPVATALRETQEEIGLASSHIEIVGLLPLYHTLTGYRVTPVVGLVGELPALQPAKGEVDEVFEVPLDFLMNSASHQRRSLSVNLSGEPEQRRYFYAMPYQHYFIWGATAGMLRNLFHFLRA